jgi:TolB-like protein
MSRLLQFLVDNAIAGDTRNTSEYAIGIAVFDRDASTYYTTEDPSVRVQVGRLREKLKNYYASVASAIEIFIPLGSYMPAFKRVIGADTNSGHKLIFRRIKCISENSNGESFAQGLQEELLHQLFKSFDGIDIVHQFHAASDEHHRSGSRRASDTGTGYLLEACARIDSKRIRTSVRLLDAKHGRINWSEQFDRKNHHDITLQEELAFSICMALKQFIFNHQADELEPESHTYSDAPEENRIVHIGQRRQSLPSVDLEGNASFDNAKTWKTETRSTHTSER